MQPDVLAVTLIEPAFDWDWGLPKGALPRAVQDSAALDGVLYCLCLLATITLDCDAGIGRALPLGVFYNNDVAIAATSQVTET